MKIAPFLPWRGNDPLDAACLGGIKFLNDHKNAKKEARATAPTGKITQAKYEHQPASRNKEKIQNGRLAEANVCW